MKQHAVEVEVVVSVLQQVVFVDVTVLVVVLVVVFAAVVAAGAWLCEKAEEETAVKATRITKKTRAIKANFRINFPMSPYLLLPNFGSSWITKNFGEGSLPDEKRTKTLGE